MTWKGLRNLDILTAAVLGRPPATTGSANIPLSKVNGNKEEYDRRTALDATFDVWLIVVEVVQKLYQQDVREPSAAKTLLSQLESWSEDLSPELQRNPSSSLPPLRAQEAILGNMHVACSYYYAVTLTTRKYLIMQLTSQLIPSSDPPLGDHSTPRGLLATTSEASLLAQTCVDSAMLTVQTCRDVLNANMILKNMCILKYVDPREIGLALIEPKSLDIHGTHNLGFRHVLPR